MKREGLALLPTYHLLVKNATDFIYSSTEQQLESHLQRLESLRLEGHNNMGKPRVTFDDGHASQFRYALPLLQKYQIKAIFFSIAGWMDERRDYMSAAQLREIASLGHEVQSHGWSHRMLTRCTETELTQELQNSRKKLQEELGTAVDAISIPFGRWNNRVLEACSVAGYKRVYTSDLSSATRHSEKVEVLGRFMVRRSTTAHDIECVVLAKRNSLLILRAAHGCKRLVRLVMGESVYHHLWGILASRKSLDEVRGEYESQPRLR
jgi:peptidoglycan/xylan/chitin deacetylase (PgdA/CDA1 family)